MKSLIKKQSTEITPYDFEEQAGDGVSDFTAQDLPRASLKLAQSLSPYVIKQNDKYIQDCQAGMIVNSGTRDIYPGDIADDPENGVVILPVKYFNREIEWLPNRGGFVAEHNLGDFSTNDIEIQQSPEGKTIRVLKNNGNTLINTATYYCFLLRSDGNYSEIVIDMASSQWQCAKDWNAYMTSIKRPSQKHKGKFFNPPIYSNVYRLFSKSTHKDGDTWFLWKVKHLKELDLKDVSHQNLYQHAIEYKKLIESGEVEVDREE